LTYSHDKALYKSADTLLLGFDGEVWKEGRPTPPTGKECGKGATSPENVSVNFERFLKLLLFRAIYYLWRYSQWITPSEGVKVRNSPVVR